MYLTSKPLSGTIEGMSIDIFCFSFREQRADEGWKQFPEDIKVLREVTYESNKFSRKRNEAIRQIREQVDEVYNEKLRLKRLEVFKSLGDRNYFLPGRTSWECEGLEDRHPGIRDAVREDYEVGTMEYLICYATMYPGGVREEGKWIMLDNDTVRAYRQIQEDRNHEIERLTQLNPLTGASATDSIVLTPRQETLRNNCDLNTLLYEDKPDDVELPYEMAMVDLHYGGVASGYFEDNKMADFLMAYLEYSGTALVSLFGESLKENIQTLANLVTIEFGWDEDESKEYIVDFLRSMKPVAKDLKEHSDAVLVYGFGGAYEFEPKHINDLLMRRVCTHITECKGILPPIL